MSVYLDFEKKLGSFHLKVQLEAGNEVLALLGASGCGKSMTLRCIAGIEKPDRGRIEVDGVTLFDSGKRINLSPQQRRTGLMFQNYALFPNMTVQQNIYTGTCRLKDRAERKRRVDDIMDRFGLAEHADHLPRALSGGQQQRTALARILVSEPQILMLDEPFSALDSHLRFRMEQEVQEVIRSFGKSVLLVSHNRDEVFRLSDKIAVMNQGSIEVYGTRDEVFRQPKTKNACMLTGCKNISPIRKLDDYHLEALDWQMVLTTGEPVGDAAYIGIRWHYMNDAGAEGTKSNTAVQNDLQADPGGKNSAAENAADGNNARTDDGNTYLCDVVNVIENPFTFTVLLRPCDKPGAEPFGWELDKDKWRQIQSGQMRIHIPQQSILLLKD